MSEEEIYPVPERLLNNVPKPYITSFDEYKKLWQESVDNPSEFFAKVSTCQNTDLFVNFFFRQQKNIYIGIDHSKIR